MFDTIEDRNAFLEEYNRHMDDGVILDDQGCMYNPWCYERWDGKQWRTLVGIQVTYDGALRHLYDLKLKNSDTKFRMYRANDLNLLTVYTE